MLVDLHVHTKRFSACGRSTPEEMVTRAMDVGLKGLVFTEHNIIWPQEELVRLQAEFPQIRLYRGLEINSAEGEDYLVYGVTDPDVIESGMTTPEIIERTHARGGAAVLAHPYRYHADVPQELDTHAVDAVEVMSSNIYNYAHQPAVALAHRLRVPAIAASDGHHVSALGLYAIDMERLPEDEAELARILRTGAINVFVNPERVDEQNQQLGIEIPEINQLIDKGLSNSAIRERLSSYVSLTVIEGLRLGKDILRPDRAVLSLPQENQAHIRQG